MDFPKPTLPQTGLVWDDDFAKALGMSVEDFRAEIIRHKVPHEMIDGRMQVDAKKFYRHLPAGKFEQDKDEA